MSRPSRHTMLIDMAVLASQRSTCDRAHVGAIIAREGRPLSVGYNGTAPGMKHCVHKRRPNMEPPCTQAIHAELNAIAWAARNGVRTEGAAIYCTHQPCVACGQAIVSAGIVEVYWTHPYHSAFTAWPEGITSLELFPSITVIESL